MDNTKKNPGFSYLSLVVVVYQDTPPYQVVVYSRMGNANSNNDMSSGVWKREILIGMMVFIRRHLCIMCSIKWHDVDQAITLCQVRYGNGKNYGR